MTVFVKHFIKTWAHALYPDKLHPEFLPIKISQWQLQRHLCCFLGYAIIFSLFQKYRLFYISFKIVLHTSSTFYFSEIGTGSDFQSRYYYTALDKGFTYPLLIPVILLYRRDHYCEYPNKYCFHNLFHITYRLSYNIFM